MKHQRRVRNELFKGGGFSARTQNRGLRNQVRELTRSQKLSFDAWLRPKGELDKERDKVKDLKLCTLCLLDETGALMMDYVDAGFDLFIEQIGEKAAGVWSDVAYHVLRVNGYIDAEEEDILGE